MKYVVHWKKSAFDVYIGRPGPWGNNFSHLLSTQAKFKVATRDEAIEKYEAWVLEQPDLIERIKKELRGKVLGCWCKPRRCHGDVLARIANYDLRNGVSADIAERRGGDLIQPDLFERGGPGAPVQE